MAIDLTERQTEILRFIRRQIDKTGLPPTRAEIAKALKFRSPNAAEEHLRALERKGVIKMLPGTSRGLRIVEPDLGLPVVGRVAAGSPILAEQHIETHYQVDPAIFRPHADYLLKVRGESMRDAGIHNGDLLAVHTAKEAKNSDIVVARLEDEVTVKRFHRSRNQVRLLPENPDFEPIEVDLRTQPLVIEGIAVGLIRAGRLV